MNEYFIKVWQFPSAPVGQWKFQVIHVLFSSINHITIHMAEPTVLDVVPLENLIFAAQF